VARHEAAPYVRWPSIHGDTIVFTSQDDLWLVAAAGGVPRRLTAGSGAASHPFLSPDGRLVAFVGREEGEAEVHVMPAEGGDSHRVTYGYAPVTTTGWTPDGRIIFSSAARQPFPGRHELFTVAPSGGTPSRLPWGPARDVAFGPSGRVALGRHTADAALWKRYRGGRAGQIWVDARGDGTFQPLQVSGNLSRPMWLGARLYFLSDHEGVGNLYSCEADGSDLVRHTDHVEYYARNAATDGRRIVYHAGGDLYLYDPNTAEARRLDMAPHAARAGRQRRFVEAGRYLDGYAVHPEGHSLLITSRGKPFAFGAWEGPVRQLGIRDGVRYRLATWLSDGRRVVMTSDAGGEEELEVADAAGDEAPRRLEGLGLGRVEQLAVSPVAATALVVNHRQEVWAVDLDAGTARQLDRSEQGGVRGVDVSPDGRWAAYALDVNRKQSEIRLCELATGEVTAATVPVLRDTRPTFDPTGTYLYFLGERVFDPVYDNLGFDLGFPRGVRPYVILLSQDTRSPFLPEPRAPGEDNGRPKDRADTSAAPASETPAEADDAAPRPVRIDREGLQERVLALPVPEARYVQLAAIDGGVLLSRLPIEGSLRRTPWAEEAEGKATLEFFDLKELKLDTLVSGVSGFDLSLDRRTLVYRSGRRLRVLRAGKKPEEKADSEPGRRSGWVHLGRVKVSVDPPAEWHQMLREAWRLMRDNFWTPTLSEVDWQRVYERYAPLLERAAVRSEVSDIIWEMQGELGTSHAYERGGDYRSEPHYPQGYLAADTVFDPAGGGYRIVHIVRGDPWSEGEDSPLRTPGARIAEGDLLVGIDGQALSAEVTPERLLVNRADAEVSLAVEGAGGRRHVTVKALSSETRARYREWVMRNADRVHEASGGQVGYLHVPDMMSRGFAEFHRGFWTEALRPGLVVDVRHNSGGHVSQLLLEKLMRRRLGYSVPRHGQATPYPQDAVLGPIVALTDESAGSDGDIFSHSFKLAGVGPLVGRRTWGGVIGIQARHPLVDGTMTTQPEFAFWFEDVGWGVENYGTDPDIPVDNTPADHAAGHDRQLERAVEVALSLIAEQRPQAPQFRDRPAKPLPDRLPPRA
jgi:tricorn protease